MEATAAAPRSSTLPPARRRTIARGVSWTAFGAVTGKGVALLSKLVLAALLLPQHFGVVSMVLVFTQLLNKVADLGLRHALVQRKRDRTTLLLYDSVFWLLLAVGLGVVAAMWLVGVPLLVWFYGVPELSAVAMVMSVGILIHNLQVVPEALLARIGAFKAIILAEVLGAFLGAAAALTLAYYSAGAWSLVAQVLVGSACTFAAMLLAARWRPRLRFAASLLQSMKQYSSYILGSRVMVHLQQNLDYLLLGKMMGAYSLGIYSVAFLLTETLRAHIYWIVSRVIFPVYARMRDDAKGIRELYCGTVRYMTLAMFPGSMLLVLYAGDAIPLLFEEVWSGSIQPVRILAIASMIMASAGTAGEVLKAVGKANIDFTINMRVTVLVAIPGLLLGIGLLGVEGAAWAVVLYCSVGRIMVHLALRREVGLTVADVVFAAAPAFAGCLLMLLCSIALADGHWMIAAAASSTAYLLAVLPVIYHHLSGDTIPRKQSNDCRVVAILGPDGSGKTTLALELEGCDEIRSRRLYLGMGNQEIWQFWFVRAFYEFHLRRNMHLARLTTGALLWYLLFPLELIARRVALRSSHRGTVLLLDRVPGQPFLKGGLLQALYRLLLPKPDLVVLLVGDPAEIAGRKPAETNASRTASEMAKWEVVAGRLRAVSIIRLDTTCNPLLACVDILTRALSGGRISGAMLSRIESIHAA